MDDRRIDRDSDLGDDSPMSNSHADDHSDREEDDMIREECESSDEGVNLNVHTNENEALDFAGSPKRPPSNATNIHHPFVPSHALSMLGNFMGVSNLPNLQHGDVLEKLKAQVGLIDPEFAMQTLRNMTTPPNNGFNMPQGSDPTSQPHNLSQQQNFSFTTPNPPNTKEGNPESNSSTTSDASSSSQQNNGWSYEEQFKQVRQLYEISDEPKRKEFLDDLFTFMQKRGTPINRLPIMAKSVLDLYELYNLVIARGGLVDVINKKLWQEIIKGLHLPSSITSAAFTLRTQYMKYLYPYECEKKSLSTPTELQAAIDGNRREGRRSSYGQFDSQMQGQLQQLVSESHGENNQVDLNMLSRLLQQQQVQRSPISSGLQQISPLSLVHQHGGSQNAHHNLLANSQIGSVGNLMTHELEQRMFNYFKMIQQTKDAQRPQSPDCIRPDTVKMNPIEQMNALEMSRVAFWSMYNNNTSPPISNNTTSPPTIEPQREALNLTDSPVRPIKRERDPVNEFGYTLPTSKKPTHQSRNHYNHEHRRHSLSSPSSVGRHHSVERETNHHDHRNGLLDYHDNPNKSISPASHHRNGTNNGSHNGSRDLLNACSPIAMLSGMQFKLFSRGSENGEPQLGVSMELNGVQYEGVLFANRVNTTQSISPSTSSPPCTPNKVPVTPSGSNASQMVEDRNRVVNTVSRPLVSS